MPSDMAPMTLALVIFGASIIILMMLLSVLSEYRKPKNKGSRKKMNDAVISQLESHLVVFEEICKEIEMKKELRNRMIDVISVLPNLEA